MIVCKICGAPQQPVHEATILGRHHVTYHLCPECGFLCLPEPHWLDEAYSTAIAALDTGAVDRNLVISDHLAVLLDERYPDGPYLDVGAGHGILVRRMRDLGFDFRWSDAIAENLYAIGFEDHGGPYEVVTAVEVLEHLEDPLGQVRAWLDASEASAFVFTQETFEPPLDPEWWYLARTTGQHISFFQPRTLTRMAEQLGKHYTSVGPLHVFADDPRPATSRERLSHRHPLVLAAARLVRRKRGSLTQRDFDAIAASRAASPPPAEGD